VTEDADRKPILVIGYGNDLRSDDGAGRWVADQIEAMSLPDVEVRSMVQLTPEVSLDIVDRRLVVFVDASVETDELKVEDVEPKPDATVLTHHGDPASVLTVGSLVGHRPGRATLVSIPARTLGIGSSFSPLAERATREAIEVIVAAIDMANRR
jgi:hydrogenase maturation protease